MPEPPRALFDQVCQHARQIALLRSIEDVLGWDEQTKMPTAGAEYRAEQMALLAGMIHRKRIDADYGRRLAELAESPLAADPLGDAGATIRRLRRDHEKKAKLPTSLVEELARTTILAQSAWQKARAEDNFNLLAPSLERIFALKRDEADALGYPQCRYDALLDDYEPEMRTGEMAAVLAGLRAELVPLVAAIGASPRRPDRAILARAFPLDRQEQLGRELAQAIGYDFRRGRLDVTGHPFCTTLGPNDCRIAIRYEERALGASVFGILHEAGHGIYEQGLRTDQFGLPLGEAASLGLHESQSRLWENLVGRSRAFWAFALPKARARFPEALGGVALDDFHFAVNDARPSLVRVEADEVTYNLHILVRFELEQAILDGQLAVADAPAAWNEKYRDYLGIVPPNDALGVLQDIHWSAGLVGYFPTYALGNLYAAQIFAQAKAELGPLDEAFAAGKFEPLRQWLAERVYRHGRRLPAGRLVEKITGKPLAPDALMNNLRAKYGPLYGL
ncbi:MAG: carboxypeptidase M32 [Pirellulales bacterium]|nr:carboxypeptidase M32 [Pirellulales bacterium]